MTNTDKTRQKLVNSMRKTKDTAAKKPAPKASAPKTATAAKKATKKSKPAGGAQATAPARRRTNSDSIGTAERREVPAPDILPEYRGCTAG